MVICKSHFSSGHFTHNQRAKSGQQPPDHYRFTFSTHCSRWFAGQTNDRRPSRSTIAARFSPAGIASKRASRPPVAIRTIFRATSHLFFSSRRGRRNLCFAVSGGEGRRRRKTFANSHLYQFMPPTARPMITEVSWPSNGREINRLWNLVVRTLSDDVWECLRRLWRIALPGAHQRDYLDVYSEEYNSTNVWLRIVRQFLTFRLTLWKRTVQWIRLVPFLCAKLQPWESWLPFHWKR